MYFYRILLLALSYVVPPLLLSIGLVAELTHLNWILSCLLGFILCQIFLACFIHLTYLVRPYMFGPNIWGMRFMLPIVLVCQAAQSFFDVVLLTYLQLFVIAVSYFLGLAILGSLLRSRNQDRVTSSQNLADPTGEPANFQTLYDFDSDKDSVTTPLAETAIPIKRVSNMDRETFYKNHIEGLGEPVVVTDAMDDWPLMKLDFADLAEKLGNDNIEAASPMLGYKLKMGGREMRPCLVRTKVSEYIKHFLNPYYKPKGNWKKGSFADVLHNRQPLYNTNYSPFRRHRSLFKLCNRFKVKFTNDYLSYIPWPLRNLLFYTMNPTYYFMLAPRGATVEFHRDFNHTHTLLFQVKGRKQVFLGLLDQKDVLEEYKDPFDPEAYENLKNCKLFTAILEAGETLFIPNDTYHAVYTVENSFTLIYNFINKKNCRNWAFYASAGGIYSLLAPLLTLVDLDSDSFTYFLDKSRSYS